VASPPNNLNQPFIKQEIKQEPGCIIPVSYIICGCFLPFLSHHVFCCHNIKFCAKLGNYATETREIVNTAYRDNDVFKAQTYDGLSVFKGQR
jgi:hypothetical protein